MWPCVRFIVQMAVPVRCGRKDQRLASVRITSIVCKVQLTWSTHTLPFDRALHGDSVPCEFRGDSVSWRLCAMSRGDSAPCECRGSHHTQLCGQRTAGATQLCVPLTAPNRACRPLVRPNSACPSHSLRHLRSIHIDCATLYNSACRVPSYSVRSIPTLLSADRCARSDCAML